MQNIGFLMMRLILSFFYQQILTLLKLMNRLFNYNTQIAGIRVQLNQLREDLDEAVKVQDFEKANAIKTQVAELDAEKARLLETTETTTEEVRTERVGVRALQMNCRNFLDFLTANSADHEQTAPRGAV